MASITQLLFELRDSDYREFQSKLIPTVDKNLVIGVRTPELRKLAKSLRGTPEAEEFLHSLPHTYYDENNLHGFLLEYIEDPDDCIPRLGEFLPYVDNWATCDLMSPKCLKKDHERLYEACKLWLASDETYTVRFAINMLMKHFSGENFKREYAELVASVTSEEYYVKMAVAWYFATILTKNYESALPYLTERRLDPWTHNKAIGKARESLAIPSERKEYLKTLKILNNRSEK